MSDMPCQVDVTHAGILAALAAVMYRKYTREMTQ
jgi:hypothetical protein